jgi:hypothetical protein
MIKKKMLQNWGTGNHLNMIKRSIYEKPIVHILLNSESLKTLLLTAEIRQGHQYMAFVFNIVVEVLDKEINEIKASNLEKNN